MREGEAFDDEVAKAESGAGIEDFPLRFVFQFWLQGFRGHHIREDDGIMFLGECGNAGGVVAVLVSDENVVDLVRVYAAVFEHAEKSFATEPGVDEHFAVFRDKQSAIARTTTAEDGKLHGHCPGIMASEL